MKYRLSVQRWIDEDAAIRHVDGESHDFQKTTRDNKESDGVTLENERMYDAPVEKIWKAITVKESPSVTVTRKAGILPEKGPDLAQKNFVEDWTSIIGSSLKESVER